MTKRLPWGWRKTKGCNLDESVYFALCPDHGRGIVKIVDDIWFFIKYKKGNEIVIPLALLEDVMCLYPIRKDYEDIDCTLR